MPFFPYLDALRAYAVLLVVLAHTFPRLWPDQGQLLPSNVGGAGVRLFFVLSGYLITQLLWRARDRAPASVVLRAFYARRAVRIFPLALFVLCLVLALGRLQHPWAYFLYLSNWLVLVNPPTTYVGVEHFWSLAVEEQFYLVWPLVILMTPKRILPALLVSSVAASMVLMIVCLSRGDAEWAYRLTPTRWSALAVGGMLALGQLPLITRLILGVSLAALAGLLLAPAAVWSNALSEAAMLVVCVWLVQSAVDGWPVRVAQVVAPAPVLALGKIAYGVYVYHFFLACTIPYLERRYSLQLGFPPEVGLARFLYVAVATLILAIPSWLWFEAPINGLKRHFPYVPSADGASHPAESG